MADFIRKLKENRISQVISNRGLLNTGIHSFRRLGSRLEHSFLGPDIIRINPVGYLCNHQCPMCWRCTVSENERAEQIEIDKRFRLTLEDYRSLFSTRIPGLREVNIVGGGEPLLHPEFIEICRIIKNRGLQGNLITNGTLLDHEVATNLLSMDWEITRVSVNAGTRSTYATVQGVDKFETLKTNLNRFIQLRRQMHKTMQCKLFLFFVIQRETIGEVKEIFQLAEDLGADAIQLDPVIPTSPEFELSAHEKALAANEIRKHGKALSIPFNSDEILNCLDTPTSDQSEEKPFVPAKSCSVGYDQALICTNGNILPCCFSSEVMGNIREKSFMDIWKGDKYESFRKRLIRGHFADYCIKYRCALSGVLHH